MRSVWEIAPLGDAQIAAPTSRDASESGWYDATVQILDRESGAWRPAYEPTWQVAALTADPQGSRLAFLEGWASDRGYLAGNPRILDVATGVLTRPPPTGIDALTLAWRGPDT